MSGKILNFVEAMQVADMILSKPLPDGFTLVDIMNTLTIQEVIKIGEFVNIPPQMNQGREYIKLIQEELIHQDILTLCKNFPQLVGK